MNESSSTLDVSQALDQARQAAATGKLSDTAVENIQNWLQDARYEKFSFGDFGIWRIAHIVLGLGGLCALIAHTGFRLGSELNFLLLMNFLLLAAFGAGATTVVAAEHRMTPSMAKHHRKRWNWLHLILFWPFPILLGVHVLKTYYF